MSNYTDFISEIVSEKIVLIEIDELQTLEDSLWIKDSANVWKLKLSWDVVSLTYTYGDGAWGYGAYGGTETTDLPTPSNDTIISINSFVADGTDWTEATSYATMSITHESFWWDVDNQTIYINSGYLVTPNDLFIKIGNTQGFSNKSSYYGGLYYEGRVTNIPQISSTRDVNYYGLISYEGGSVSLVNTDGYFDTFQNRGQIVKIFFGGDDLDYTDFNQVFEGYIEQVSISADEITLDLQDTRKLLQKSIPRNVFTTTNYPSLDDDEVNEFIPIGYGTIRNAKATPIDTLGNFVIVDTEFNDLTSISAVYMNGVSVTFGSVSTTNGTFNITDASYDDGDRDDITVDFIANSIIKPLDMIKNILVNYTDIEYTDLFFNITDWEAYNLVLTQELGLFINEKTEIIDIIGDICYAVQGLFIIEGDGRISFKKQDTSAVSVKDIMLDELVSPSTIVYDQENYASTVRVGYHRDWEEEEFRFIQNDSKENELSIEYRISTTKEVETLLTLPADATALAAEFLDYYGSFTPTFTFTTKTQNLDIRIEDNVNLQTYFYETGDYASIKLEIIGIETNFNNFTTTFTGRYIETVSGEIDLTALIRWNPTQSYATGQVTSSGGSLWRAIAPSVGELPSVSGAYWQPAVGYYETIYIISALQPTTPTGDTPVGWTSYPPVRAAGEVIWASNGFKDDDDILIGTWSAPTQWSGDKGEQGTTFVDGGTWDTIYQPDQIIDGGGW